MNFLSKKGSSLPYISYAVVESTSQYYSTIELVVAANLPDREIIAEDKGKRYPMIVMGCDFDDNGYSYTLVPESVNDLLSSVFEPFEGNSSVRSVLSRVGIKASFQGDSVPCYWRIPRCKLMSLMRYLSYYSDFGNGGTAKFYIGLDGGLNYVDVRSAYQTKQVRDIQADITNDSCNLDWELITPGIIDLYVYSKDGTSKQTLTFEKGYGRAVSRVNDTTGHEAEMMKSILASEFYDNYYNARTLVIPNLVTSVALGDVISVNGKGKYVVTQITYAENGQSKMMSAVIHSPYADN